MTDIEERQADQDPEPLKHSDAERVGSENAEDSEAAYPSPRAKAG